MSTDVKASPDFTPTESLILEVLVARYRLGDTLWTFDSRNAPALRKLEEKKLVHLVSGVTENTIRAWLSDHALLEHGASWFQLSITRDHLPDAGRPGPDPSSWSKRHLERLVELSQQDGLADPRAINIAHALMIQIIARHYPVYQALPGTHGAVVLKRGDEPGDGSAPTIRIAPNGESFQLYRGERYTETVNQFGEALYFASGDVR